jgi:hypothetical protein
MRVTAPYYVRDDRACERLKANLKTVYDWEVRAPEIARPQTGINWDATMNRLNEMDLWGEPPLLRVRCRRHSRKQIFGPCCR